MGEKIHQQLKEKTGEVVNGLEITEMKEKLRTWAERMTYKLGSNVVPNQVMKSLSEKNDMQVVTDPRLHLRETPLTRR